MAKIILAGDNHGDLDSIAKILNQNPCGDYYFHTGDCCVDPKRIEPFISVQGNNDNAFYQLPKERVMEVNEHRILLLHGQYYVYDMNSLVYKAEQENCDIVFYGHSHVFADFFIGNIHFVNPGSTYYNRDGDDPSYAVVEVNKKDVIVQKKYVD